MKRKCGTVEMKVSQAKSALFDMRSGNGWPS